jgi:hypothetical protein
MGVQCHKCGSRNTSIVKARDLAKAANDPSVLTGCMGIIPVVLIGKILDKIFQFLGKLFGFLEEKQKNDASVVVCRDCGYYERVGDSGEMSGTSPSKRVTSA